MAKKTENVKMITWRVGDGPVHEIPDGATVTFETEKDLVKISIDGDRVVYH
jgi:hypothetical protein